MDYVLVVKVPFSASDDMGARIFVRDFLKEKDLSPDSLEMKLQEVFKGKAPRGLGSL